MNFSKNEEGNIRYIDVKKLVDLALDNQIVFGIKGAFVFAYVNEPEDSPIGWRKVSYETYIQTLMRDENMVNYIYNTLKEKGVDFVPSVPINEVTKDKKSNMSYWDAIDDFTMDFVKNFIKIFGFDEEGNYVSEDFFSDDTLKEKLIDVSKEVTKKIVNSGIAQFPYVDENY